jgi:hypothetical protein
LFCTVYADNINGVSFVAFLANFSNFNRCFIAMEHPNELPCLFERHNSGRELSAISSTSITTDPLTRHRSSWDLGRNFASQHHNPNAHLYRVGQAASGWRFIDKNGNAFADHVSAGFRQNLVIESDRHFVP